MWYRTFLVTTLLVLASCSGEGPESTTGPAAGDGQAGTEPSWREERAALGQATYQVACASCHDSGEGGAPVTGQREDWADRSGMWQAVLFEHAKSGYLDMPGKGGQEELSDEAVEAATEYMMEQTFPELPRD
jgi:cytochrome c5